MAFRRILFPVDFSGAAIAMVPAVREIANRFEAHVTVLNAFNLVREYNLAPDADGMCDAEPEPVPYTEAFQELRDRRKLRLESLAAEQFAGISHTAQLEDGDPARVIEWAARRDDADLIVMPTKGLGKFRRLLLGSVTAKVLHDVSCPVLTSAHQSAPGPVPFSGFRSIVCAVHLSSESENLFRTAAFLAQAYEARICLLHIKAPLEENGQRATTDEIGLAYERALDGGGVRTGTKPGVRILDAGIPESIRETVLQEAADLVIVGRGHMQDTFSQAWSHLYAIVRESPCPVLSV